MKPVVVGFDGSVHSRQAVDWAADEAALRRRPLLIVHSYLKLAPMAPVSGSERAMAAHKALEELVEAEMERVRRDVPGVAVSSLITGGLSASYDLIEASSGAEVMVVGSRGRGAFADLLLGSTATQVMVYSQCPVVVVRGSVGVNEAGPDKVVVGVDGSPSSQEALRFGFEEASMRGARLVAVHAWKYPVSTGPGDMLPLLYDLDALADDEERLLAESMAGWQSKFPDVPVERVNTRGDVRKILKEHSAGARLLVLGSRGHGGFSGLLLGSVTRAMAHHAMSPVAVIYASKDE